MENLKQEVANVDLIKIRYLEVEMTHNIIRPISSGNGMFHITHKNLQWHGVERFDMGLVHKTSVSCGLVCSYEDAQASD